MISKSKLAKLAHMSCSAIALTLCSTSGVLMTVGAAWAQSSTSVASTDASGDGVGVGAIVVTARRVAENLQDVPQQVTAVTGEDLSKLNITQFEDIATVVPALTLGRDGYGFAAPSIRGIPFDFIASVAPTVDIYLNEVPIEPRMAFSAMFDVGNVQVLEGPQGTARGRTAPSGAILLTARNPDLDQFGGYFSGLAAEFEEYNVQGAVNVPVIPGKLAIRAAGLYSSNRGDLVRSVNSAIKPKRRDIAGRLTALFKPSDDFEALITYQHQDQDATSFPGVVGSGSPGATYTNTAGTVLPNPFAPANFNGPPLTPFDRRGVSDFATNAGFKYDFITGQVNANVLGHNLTYIGGYWELTGQRKNEQDDGNQILGRGFYQQGTEPSNQITQELRIASESGGFFDYTFGYFFSRIKGSAATGQPGRYLPGTFGPAAPYDPSFIDERYILPITTDAPLMRKEHSVFGSVTLRPGPATEVTLGGRYLILTVNNQILISSGEGRTVATPSFGLPCSVLSSSLVPSYYPGYCDFPIPAGIVGDYRNELKRKPFVYNASISHRFTDDILAYATVASSYRMPFASLGIRNGNNDPLLNQLAFPDPEKSTSYEVGLKTNWLDNRLRVNVAAFYQKFDGLLFSTQSVPYVSVVGNTPEVSTANFNVNGDAIVKGFNLDMAFQPTRHFLISGAVSYSKAKLDDALVPCRDSNFDGVPDAGSPDLGDFPAGVSVAQCRSSEVVGRDPLWKATLQSEFSHPINDQMDGYLRGLLTYNSSNPYRNAGFTAKDYALLSLYAGVRSADSAWDLGLFMRNATNTKVELSRGEDDLNADESVPFGPAGYRTTSVNAPRQFGITLRYAFGGR